MLFLILKHKIIMNIAHLHLQWMHVAGIVN